jgi:hypothetical protein
MCKDYTKLKSLDELGCAMMKCQQTKTQDVLEHGYSIHNYFRDLKDHILYGSELQYEWKLPDWIYEENLWDQLLDYQTIRSYHIYHDCGKPFCRYVDDEGRQHFPNHETISGQVWRHIGGDEQIARLMEMDMDIHRLRTDGVEEFASRPEAATLLITGLCEINSNARMFGGIHSTSFKIKYKNLAKYGGRIAERLCA